MQAFFDFLKWLIENTIVWWVIVEPWEEGLRIRLGKKWVKIGPGWHWKIPVIDKFETTNVQKQVVNLPNQSVITSNGITLAISGAVTYSIKAVEKYFLNVQDPDRSIQTLAMTHIGAYVAAHSNADCTYKQIVDAVFPDLRREGFKWGVEIEDFALTDLCQCRALRLMTMDMPAVHHGASLI